MSKTKEEPAKCRILPLIIMAFLLAAAMIYAAVPRPAHALSGAPDRDWYNPASGKSEFEISSADDLAGLAELVNAGTSFSGKTVILTDDIDLSNYGQGSDYNGGKGWIPIGWNNAGTFSGSFDGGGHVVSGLYINSQTYHNAGLFGWVDGGFIKNLGIRDAYIKGGDFTGGIAGCVGNSAGGGISDCFVTGEVSGGNYVGGIAGAVNGRAGVTYCYASCEVSGNGNVGGITNFYGSPYGLTVNCVALNPYVSGLSNAGRVTGNGGDDMLSNNYALGSMSGGTWVNKTTDGNDGGDITAEQPLVAEFWTDAAKWRGSCWDTYLWVIRDGELPRLISCDSKADISGGAITLSADTFIYDGTAKTPDLTVEFDGVKLREVFDYAVSYANNIAAGTAGVSVTGTGAYKGTLVATFKIRKAVPVAADLDFTIPAGHVYNGSEQGIGAVVFKESVKGTGNVTVKYNGSEELPGDAGLYTVTAVIGSGANYKSATVWLGEYKINKADPYLTIPDGLESVYGSLLSDVPLQDGWKWLDGDVFVGDAGSRSHDAVYVPGDADNYNIIMVSLNVEVSKAVPTVEDLDFSIPAGHIYSGAAMGIGGVALKSGKTGAGEITIKYNGSCGTPLNAGSYEVTAVFECGSNYKTATIVLGQYIITRADRIRSARRLVRRLRGYTFKCETSRGLGMGGRLGFCGRRRHARLSSGFHADRYY